MNTSRAHDCDGFSLVELMTVVLIIGTLVLIVVPVMLNAVEKSSATTCLANRAITERAEYAFELQSDRRSASVGELISAGYLQAAPRCPSGGVYIWQETEGSDARSLACSIHFALGLEALFKSGFTDMTGLTPLMGKWSIVNGRLVGSSYQNRISFGSNDWTDYTLSLIANLQLGSGYGVYYRADGKTDISGYCFQFDPGLGNKFVVRTVTNGKESGPLKTVTMPKGFDIYGTDHQIDVTVSGNHHIIKVDGVVVMEFDDTTYSSGSAGLRTWNNSKASFDDLAINPILGK